MILKRIILRNFRNYEVQEIDFNPTFNFIHGDNGHGKTNILEAISLLTYGRSFIGTVDNECVKFGNDEFFIEGEFENNLENKFLVRLIYSNTLKKKSYFLNGEKVSGFSTNIFGRFPVVFLSPQNLSITYGNPSERRKFFDILIAQTSKVYLNYLKDLSKILKQKNALLKNNLTPGNYSDKDFHDLLDSYNEKFLEASENIIFKRLEFLSDFIDYFRKNFSELIIDNDEIFIHYYSDVFGEMFDGKLSIEEIRSALAKEMNEKMKEEILRGISLVGPQRDDYIFRLKKVSDNQNSKTGFALKSFGSQGEHKTFLIALKLAEYYYLMDILGTKPILMLDDVLSELDYSRITNIISHLNTFGQILLTTTDINYSKGIKNFYSENEVSLFNIRNGKVLQN